MNINIGGADQTPRRRLVVWNSLRKDTNEVTTGSLILHGILQGLSPLKLQDEINFLRSDGTITSALYNAPRELTSALPSAFADSLIHDIIEETNDYGMQECFWDENTEAMQLCINGAYLTGRATTISRSVQIVGNTTYKPVNENFTLCEGNNYVDCETDTTGADLLVQDEIEAIGSIFSQENITVDDTGFFSFLGSLINRITKLWVQDINVNGTLNATGNVIVNGSKVCLEDGTNCQSVSGGNIFDQSLNTTDDVEFDDITSTGTGFFSFLGNLTNKITRLFVQDIDVSSSIKLGFTDPKGNCDAITEGAFLYGAGSGSKREFWGCRQKDVGEYEWVKLS